ncbi:nucleotidyltransferase [Legionella longbeachae]|uniref:nucleotidyltransferase domain-containing protein n=1 Tax=Legionella longbeachae TaxID=450 RepID=UPI001C1C052B|nr:nucleotidyltransferase [Legionella pneumophila]
MNNDDFYLIGILNKYQHRDLSVFSHEISNLKNILQNWASIYYMDIFDSGSRAKGTAISLASDVDFVISLSNSCTQDSGGLKTIYQCLYDRLKQSYQEIRKQNVSVRIHLNQGFLQNNQLEIDVTPARKHTGNTNDHSIWISKRGTWQQTNIQKHIYDIRNSGREYEIKLLKIWRELNQLDFPSIYLEYLIINHLLKYKPKGLDFLASNFIYLISELANTDTYPLWNLTVIDPANSNNILSDLLTIEEKGKIISAAIDAKYKFNLSSIVY